MEINTETREGVQWASLEGRNLDASVAARFKSLMVPILQENANIVLDMSAIEFVDSSGLGSLLSCLRQCNAAGGSLKLCGLQKGVRVVFELVRMHRVFELYETPQEAAQAFASQT